MAITKEMAYRLMLQVKQHSLTGHVLQLGKQDIWVNYEELSEIAKRCSFERKYDEPPELVKSQFLDEKMVVSDSYFFKSLGFSQVSSLDASEFEAATFTHDLNKTPVPEKLRERFDVIYDLGTMEHIFHLPNVLNNIHCMLKVGGHIVHGSPCSNAFQHGFYMFSPCFYFDYYQANGYELIESTIVRYRVNWKKELTDCEILDCPPGSEQLALLSYIGSLDDRYYGINVTVRKIERSTSGIVPQQGYYQTVWAGRDSDQSKSSDSSVTSSQVSVGRKAFDFVERIPLLGLRFSRGVRFIWYRLKARKRLRWEKIKV